MTAQPQTLANRTVVCNAVPGGLRPEPDAARAFAMPLHREGESGTREPLQRRPEHGGRRDRRCSGRPAMPQPDPQPILCNTCAHELAPHCDHCTWLVCTKHGCPARFYDLERGIRSFTNGDVQRIGAA